MCQRNCLLEVLWHFIQLNTKSNRRRASLFLYKRSMPVIFQRVGFWHQILFLRYVLTAVPVPERCVLSGEAEMIYGIFIMSWVLVVIGWLTSSSN